MLRMAARLCGNGDYCRPCRRAARDVEGSAHANTSFNRKRRTRVEGFSFKSRTVEGFSRLSPPLRLTPPFDGFYSRQSTVFGSSGHGRQEVLLWQNCNQSRVVDLVGMPVSGTLLGSVTRVF